MLILIVKSSLKKKQFRIGYPIFTVSISILIIIKYIL